MNSHNDTGPLLSVLACNLNIIMIKENKTHYKQLRFEFSYVPDWNSRRNFRRSPTEQQICY